MLRVGGLIPYSQNFISDPNLVKRLIKQSNISISDLVIDIGAGKGVITKTLRECCKQVVAVEIDKILFNSLLNSANATNVTYVNNDFLKVTLPNDAYKVFSNIPFNHTSRIMNKLYFQGNSPQSAYIIMQKEACDLYMGNPRETQKSLLIKPFFRVEVFHKFNKTDFRPVPAVDIEMLHIEKLEKPLLNKETTVEYFDFVVYGTTQYKTTLKKSLSKIFTHEQFKRLASNLRFSIEAKPLDITYLQWVDLYKYFKIAVIDEKKVLIKGSYCKQQAIQKQLKKCYQTRKHS